MTKEHGFTKMNSRKKCSPAEGPKCANYKEANEHQRSDLQISPSGQGELRRGLKTKVLQTCEQKLSTEPHYKSPG